MKQLKHLIKILTFLLIINSNSFGSGGLPATTAACKAATKGSTSLVQVLTNSITTIYNVFPIKIASVQIIPGVGPNAVDRTPQYSMPICICPIPYPPYIRIGITVSFWEPFAVSEPSNIPNCLPSLGISLPIPIVGGMSFQAGSKGNVNNYETYQVTHTRYPIFKMLGMLIDFVCLAPDMSVDVAYPSALDPLYQNDLWSAIINPEVFLLSNPIAQIACSVDAVAATLGSPIDALYWCFGSWNGAFPLTKHTKGITAPQTAAGIVARMMAKLHRQFMLFNTMGQVAMCLPHPMPIMPKSAYGIFPVYPLMPYPFRIQIGQSGMLWEHFTDIPVANNHVWSWVLYRKRDCCAF